MTDNNKPKFEFKGKYIIEADIVLKTALHIGGTEEGFEIGGIDNPVIKDKVTGVPYIPGSSLKGKFRSLLEWAYFDPNDERKRTIRIEANDKGEWQGKLCSDPTHAIGIVFGVAAEAHKGDVPGPTRLTVRDAYPNGEQVKNWENIMGEKIYTEAKTENSIDRLTSAATPRTMERVPVGSIFKAEFVYDVYKPEDINHLKILFEGMQLLEDSYLGGGGTRGSGQVEFKNIVITLRDKSYYLVGNNAGIECKQNGHSTAKEIIANFITVFPPI